MAFDTTMTESDFETAGRNLPQSLANEFPELEPDLSVDGLSDSVFSRLLCLFGLT